MLRSEEHEVVEGSLGTALLGFFDINPLSVNSEES